MNLRTCQGFMLVDAWLAFGPGERPVEVVPRWSGRKGPLRYAGLLLKVFEGGVGWLGCLGKFFHWGCLVCMDSWVQPVPIGFLGFFTFCPLAPPRSPLRSISPRMMGASPRTRTGLASRGVQTLCVQTIFAPPPRTCESDSGAPGRAEPAEPADGPPVSRLRRVGG